MQKFIFCVLISFLGILHLSGNTYSKDSLVRRLDETLKQKEYFITEKKQKIDLLKQMLDNKNSSLEQKYAVNAKIFDEYEKFQSDSALLYLNRNRDLALKLGNKNFLLETNIKIASVYSTIGLFVEAKEILDEISVQKIDKNLLTDYYEAHVNYYDRYGQNNENLIYIAKSEQYRDSLMTLVADTSSLTNKILYAKYSFDRNEQKRAEYLLQRLLKHTKDTDRERAMIAYLLGIMYMINGDLEAQETYFMISAISDVTTAIRDNASLQSLALTYFKTGNIDRAYQFMDYAIDDALYCNVKYRALGGLTFYPVINAAYQAKEAEQKAKLSFYLILITILVVFLAIALVYVYLQMKKVSKIREELYATSVKLIDLNQELKNANLQLNESNVKLQEASHVKEEYIAQFFDLCSEYIEKIESYRISLNKLAISKQLETLYQKLKSTSLVDDELEGLYSKFDSIFISLYPSFIADFNVLMKDDEKVVLKQNEVLNTELRIFALIRLGITDSAKIAKFLRYSISTIYNYRTTARNKAIVSRHEFEEKIMTIGVNQE